MHLQEIIAINEVKSDMRDGKVNWTKASQLSKAASTVMFCARFAPDLPTNEAMEHLILRAPVLDEDVRLIVLCLCLRRTEALTLVC